MTGTENTTIRGMHRVEDLILDPNNPRILDRLQSQHKLIEHLYYSESLEELALSFKNNGYFEEEPLVIVKEENLGYVVVEGNRRLATLKLLLNPELLRSIVDTPLDWPDLSEGERERLYSVPTVLYPNRQAVSPYLGFRHITGARTWKPLQKARFVASLVDSGLSLREVQERIGNPKASAAKTMYQSYVLYEQIKRDLPSFDIAPVNNSFSLLETLLGSAAIKFYLGIPSGLPAHRVSSLVPTEKLNNLDSVLVWIFGGEDSEPIISDSRDIKKKLGSVVESAQALAVLKRTDDLDIAYEVAVPNIEVVAEKVQRLRRRAAELLPEVRDHSNEQSVVAAVRGLAQTVSDLGEAVNVRSHEGRN